MVDDDAVVTLGGRLKESRQSQGLSLREAARQLSVSPSFVSQMENGKSQPSVATLYAMASLYDVSIDSLFRIIPGLAEASPTPATERSEPTVSRSGFSSPSDAWTDEGASARLQIVNPTERPRIVMDSGVIWEQLASNRARELDFMEITYPPGSSSTSDSRMLRHDGLEYGYLLDGELQITYAFESFTLRQGESMCLDSSVPHLFTNHGSVPARGIWVVHHLSHQRDSE